MAQWAKIDFRGGFFANASEEVIGRGMAAAENCYLNAAGAHSRFPGLETFADVNGTRTYLYPWQGDLIAVTDAGSVYRIGDGGMATNVTGAAVAGGRRVIFDKTESDLLMAAGGPIIRLSAAHTQILSEDAPDSTHVCFIAGYVIAIEANSGRFWYSDPGAYRTWNDLSVFTAEAKSDDVLAAVVSPFEELLLAGEDSIEQFRTLANGDRPFYRSIVTGDGIAFPYTMLSDTFGVYGVNKRREFVRFTRNVSQDQGEDIGLLLQAVDDWTDAWVALVPAHGQKWIVLQIPFATNPYGTKGLTLLLDYRAKRWSSLYGWDADLALPTRWPGWSYASQWGRHFVGVPGGVAELKSTVFDQLGQPQRMLIRTGHIADFNTSRIDGLQVRIKRGVGAQGGVDPRIGIRANRDNRGFTPWVYRSLGTAGHRDAVVKFPGFGYADDWQFEIQVTDPVQVEVIDAQILVERVDR